MSEVKLVPVFVGMTQDGTEGEVILYKEDGSTDPMAEGRLYIRRPDLELLLCSLGSEFTTWFDLNDSRYHIQIKSPEWTGYAIGSKEDLLRADPIFHESGGNRENRR